MHVPKGIWEKANGSAAHMLVADIQLLLLILFFLFVCFGYDVFVGDTDICTTERRESK